MTTRQLSVLAILVCALFFAPLAVTEVSSHGDSTVIYRGAAGPYQLSLRIQPAPPRVGTVHFSVFGLNSGRGSPIAEPRINIVAINSSGEHVYQTPAIKDPDNPDLYEGNILFRDAGEWSIEVTVDTKEHGEGSVVIPIQINPASIEPGPEGSIVFALITLALLSGTAYLWYTARKARAASRANP